MMDDSASLVYWLTSFAIAAICGVAVGQDADRHKISIDGKPYTLNNGKWAWGISTFLLLIVTVPYYLIKRGDALKKEQVSVPVTRSLAAELAELEAMKTAGKITAGDYERAKAKLLG